MQNPIDIAKPLLAQGFSMAKIGENLTNQGIMTPRGKPWTANSVSYLLKGTKQKKAVATKASSTPAAVPQAKRSPLPKVAARKADFKGNGLKLSKAIGFAVEVLQSTSIPVKDRAETTIHLLQSFLNH